jgi:hypothetical protein
MPVDLAWQSGRNVVIDVFGDLTTSAWGVISFEQFLCGELLFNTDPALQIGIQDLGVGLDQVRTGDAFVDDKALLKEALIQASPFVIITDPIGHVEVGELVDTAVEVGVHFGELGSARVDDPLCRCLFIGDAVLFFFEQICWECFVVVGLQEFSSFTIELRQPTVCGWWVRTSSAPTHAIVYLLSQVGHHCGDRSGDGCHCAQCDEHNGDDFHRPSFRKGAVGIRRPCQG